MLLCNSLIYKKKKSSNKIYLEAPARLNKIVHMKDLELQQNKIPHCLPLKMTGSYTTVYYGSMRPACSDAESVEHLLLMHIRTQALYQYKPQAQCAYNTATDPLGFISHPGLISNLGYKFRNNGAQPQGLRIPLASNPGGFLK